MDVRQQPPGETYRRRPYIGSDRQAVILRAVFHVRYVTMEGTDVQGTARLSPGYRGDRVNKGALDLLS